MSSLAPLAAVASGRLQALTFPRAEQRYAHLLYQGRVPQELQTIKTRLEDHVRGSGLTVLVLNDGGTPYLSLDGRSSISVSSLQHKFKTEIEDGDITYVSTPSSGARIFAPHN